MTWHDAPRLAELLTHAIAILVVRLRTKPGRASFAPSLRPLFWFLTVTFVADVIRWGIQAKVLRDAPRPFVGSTRLLFHVDQAGIIGWNAGLIMICVAAFAHVTSPPMRRTAFGTVVAWLGTTCVLAAAYPSLRGDALGHAYAMVQLATVVAAGALAVRAWGKDAWFGVAPRAASILVVGEAATLLGPYLGEPFRYWATANVISACVHILLTWELRRSRHALP